MKRAYRERALSRLYEDLQSDDFDAREYALFQLVLLLRRANPDASADDIFAGEQLSRELRRIRLSPADQATIVERLMRLISRHEDSRASVFWALGDVSANVAFARASAAMGEFGDQFSGEAAFQACQALTIWLNSDDFDLSLADALRAEKKPLRLLSRWASASDARLANCANAVMSRLRELSD
ncbi:MAG: hypothetical protein OXI77_00190 [Chloroflexota bacterium]|nr:hypothetical protein [Chloroflexota bacterium]MDE2911127.1 hypothetical protein [Chloroflexota bacterium]